MVGRDDTVHLLSTQLMMSRFLSIIGRGGIGKTTAAVAVAHALPSGFGDAVFFVDLPQYPIPSSGQPRLLWHSDSCGKRKIRLRV
jgi:ABC-type glutathione transport system ATPase component